MKAAKGIRAASDLQDKFQNALQWNPAIQELRFSFQPIVNIHSGQLFGLEALLRNFSQSGWDTIQSVFDSAYDAGFLYSLDVYLRCKAISQFAALGLPESVGLFYNLDNRLLETPDYTKGNTIEILRQNGISEHRLYFEVSERHPLDPRGGTTAGDLLQHYKNQKFHIVLDDFGTGYAGLKMLYKSEPELIKIDRFFINGIDSDARKKMFIAGIVETAHIMGIVVIAEGVETAAEYHTCREIGCDYIQGYYIQLPQDSSLPIGIDYYHIRKQVVDNQRTSSQASLHLIQQEMLTPPTIPEETSLLKALGYFGKHSDWRFFPVVNAHGEALGILREKVIKQFVYSPFGISLLQNPSVDNDIHHIIDKIPQVELTSRLGRVIEALALDRTAEALILTQDGRYCGMLDSNALVQIMHHTQLNIARDQNPLTRLPGNNLIQEYLLERFSEAEESCLLVYFDFDSFKPFNDVLGFRLGDRVIQLFADLLRGSWLDFQSFIGHIGGDDFFLGLHSVSLEYLEDQLSVIQNFMDNFADSVLAFYPEEIRTQGYIISPDRHGRKRKYNPISVSAAAALVENSQKMIGIDELSCELAGLKKQAKKKPGSLVVKRFL
jgi:diguanylate cyclase (GGDEF)-like protein